MRKSINGLIISLLLIAITAPLSSLQAGSYRDSAHGDPQFGVRRLDQTGQRSAPRATGSCGHCHDKALARSIGQAEGTSLYAVNFNRQRQLGPYQQDDLFCFSCHTSVGSLQAGAAAMGNFDYSRNFGGLTTGGPLSILDAFNQPAGGLESSYHNLYDIWNYAQRFPGFGQDSSPCSACHNSHRARRNRAHVANPEFSAISLPDEPDELWGDQAEETMARYAGRYQPPLSAGLSGGYEPGGVQVAFADGSQLPDYNSFCLRCHAEPVYSTTLARSVVRVDWAAQGGDSPFSGDKHGMNAFTQSLQAVAPYDDPRHQFVDYLLACSDCHEPHGSQNARLIRRGVNGSALRGKVSAGSGSTSLGYLCRQCHADDAASAGSGNSQQINRWETVHHSAADRPYPPGDSTQCVRCHDVAGEVQAIGCGYCHGHGSYVDAENPGILPNGKRIPAPEGGVRRTF